MKQIRHGVFETNSSSTHAIEMCTKAEYNAWINNEVYFVADYWGLSGKYNHKDFLTKNEVIDAIANAKHNYGGTHTKEELEAMDEKEFEKLIRRYDTFTFRGYWEYFDYLYGFQSEYTTPAGDEVVAFGVYGYDG